jgi:hypothetical protein
MSIGDQPVKAPALGRSSGDIFRPTFAAPNSGVEHSGIGGLTAPPHSGRSFCTESVQAHWRETKVGEHGEVVLEGLPFEPGQPVEVLVVSKTPGSKTTGISIHRSRWNPPNYRSFSIAIQPINLLVATPRVLHCPIMTEDSKIAVYPHVLLA